MHFGEIFVGNPATVVGLEGQLGAIYDELPAVGVNGSIGRQIIMASYVHRALGSLDLTRRDGSLRDLDVMSTEGSVLEVDATPPDTQMPLRLDVDLGRYVRREANGTWLVCVDDESIHEEVDPAVFELVTRHAGDVAVRTFNVHTQAQLNGNLVGAPLIKHRGPFRVYRRFVAGLADDQLQAGDRPLPASAYEPFGRLGSAIAQKYPLRRPRLFLRDVNGYLPSPVRALVRPLRHLANLGGEHTGLPDLRK